jgi:hypothetical protein
VDAHERTRDYVTEEEFLGLVEATRQSRHHWRDAAMLMLTFLPWPARKTEQAIERLAECLATPLQIEHYLTLALEQAYRFGEKPVTPEIIATVMAPDIEALEPTLARQGYNVKTLGCATK